MFKKRIFKYLVAPPTKLWSAQNSLLKIMTRFNPLYAKQNIIIEIRNSFVKFIGSIFEKYLLNPPIFFCINRSLSILY